MVHPPDFDALYASDDDPWQVGTSFYEQRKLGIVLASLASPSYRLAWDPAAGTGELARRLARRSSRVVGTDLSPRAVEIARSRCRSQGNVSLSQLTLPGLPAAGPDLGTAPFRPDLVVISEFLYYLDAPDRRRTLELLDEVAADSAEVMSLHWRHRAEDAWLSGAEMQTEIGTVLVAAGWRHTLHHEETDFVLDAFRRDPSTQAGLSAGESQAGCAGP